MWRGSRGGRPKETLTPGFPEQCPAPGPWGLACVGGGEFTLTLPWGSQARGERGTPQSPLSPPRCPQGCKEQKDELQMCTRTHVHAHAMCG